MFDDPPGDSAERYAENSSAPTPGLSPGELQVMSPSQHGQMREFRQPVLHLLQCLAPTWKISFMICHMTFTCRLHL
eukprot:2532002-Amphidinium_carterae.5